LCLSMLFSFAPSAASAQRTTPATAFGTLSLGSRDARSGERTPATAFGDARDGLGLSIANDSADSFSAELAYADGESHAAATLYASSFILLGVGAVTGVTGALSLFIGAFGGSGPMLGVGIALWGVGGVGLLGHIVTMALAISYDVGSGARHRSLEQRSAGVAFRVTSGPGDVGLGAALAF
ncbi:MAG: hypothetical protein K1X94_36785, partial [Sandaracinaceae bacterium]|nr:hypothetical protein [Sandaracinaceae bacterium]